VATEVAVTTDAVAVEAATTDVAAVEAATAEAEAAVAAEGKGYKPLIFKAEWS
jgi:hypothetical protein